MKRLDELDGEIDSSSQLRTVLYAARDLFKEAAVALDFQQAELEARLATIPPVNDQGGIRGVVNSRTRARLVARHVGLAAAACRAASLACVKCWRSFVKHYAPEIDGLAKSKKPRFKVDE